MGKISIDVGANFTKVADAVKSLDRMLSGLEKKSNAAFGGKGASATNSPVATMTKQMKELEKQTVATQQKLQLLQTTLQNVQAKQAPLQGLGGVGRQKQLQQLNAQEAQLQQQIQRAQTGLANKQNMANVLQQQSPQQGGAAGGGMSNFIGGFGKQMVGMLAGVAIGALVKKAFETAAAEEKGLADLLPRIVTPGGLPFTGGARNRIAGLGYPLGFTGQETIQAMGAMSAGGSRLGGGLERDTQASLQYARMFGLDAGSVAGGFAGAQRTGAFKAGDAKKFASMLAGEIAHTGLGPRAQEVQEATLMLLHGQLRTQTNASMGGVMALQTVMNRSGMAAFTGTAGASAIGTMNEHIQNPQGEAQDAYLQSIYFRDNPKGDFYGYQLWKEDALKNPGTLPSVFGHLNKDFGGGRAAAFQAKGLLGISMHQAMALSPMVTSGNMRGAAAALAGGNLEGGAAQAMGLTGNKLRRGEGAIDELMSRGGHALLPQVANFQDWASKELGGILSIVDHTKSSADALQALAGNATAGAPAWVQGAAKATGKKVGGLWDQFQNDWSFGKMDPTNPANWGNLSKWAGWKPSVQQLASSHNLKMTSMFRSPEHNRAIGGSPTSKHLTGQAMDFAGSPEEMAAFYDEIKERFPGRIQELFYGPKGSVKNNRYYPAGSKGWAKTERGHMDHVHVSLSDEPFGKMVVEHHIYEHGVVAESSRQAVKHVIRQTIKEERHNSVRANPNKR